MPTISWLLLKGFFWRLRTKYVIRDFHPLVFFYIFGFVMTLLGLALGILEVVLRIEGNAVSAGTVVLVALLLIFGSQFTLFAMWFDMESNEGSAVGTLVSASGQNASPEADRYPLGAVERQLHSEAMSSALAGSGA